MHSPGDGDPGSDPTLYARAASNIAMGLDHMVVIRPTGAAKRTDDCGATGANSPVPLPNWIYAAQYDDLVGNPNFPTAARVFTDGIASGLLTGGPFTDGKPARLLRYPAGSPTRTLALDSGNVTVDDRPLWDYIRLGAVNIPTECERSSFDAIDPSDPDNTGPDPAAFWRVKGARDLTSTQAAILQALFAYREQQAERIDRPPFKVMGEATLMELVRRAPRHERPVGSVPKATKRHC